MIKWKGCGRRQTWNNFKQGCTNFPKSNSHLKILVPRGLKQNKNYTEDPQVLGATVQNSVARDLYTPDFKYPIPSQNMNGETEEIAAK